MTYFKCTSCKTRLYSVESPDNLACDLCPGCGAMLDAVGELVAVGGYHSIADRSSGLTLFPVPVAQAEGLSG